MPDSVLQSGSWKDAVNPSCDSPDTSRRFALGSGNVGLVGENPTCSVRVESMNLGFKSKLIRSL